MPLRKNLCLRMEAFDGNQWLPVQVEADSGVGFHPVLEINSFLEYRRYRLRMSVYPAQTKFKSFYDANHVAAFATKSWPLSTQFRIVPVEKQHA